MITLTAFVLMGCDNGNAQQKANQIKKNRPKTVQKRVKKNSNQELIAPDFTLADLDSVTMEDDYEGNFDTRRALLYTLRFTAKTYLYGPVTDVSSDVVRKVQIGYIAGNRATGAYDRDVTYSVVPKATKDYDGDDKTFLSENVDLTETVITVDNAEALTVNTNIYVGQENIYIDKISGNDLTVKRGQFNTTAQEHVLGAKVYEITSADADLIEVGDDFGFDGSVF